MPGASRTFFYVSLLIPGLMMAAFICPAQSDLGFQRLLNIPVTDSTNHPYLFPWAGGLNSCQFSTIDLNLDGIPDLFVFDRNGNRILTFINNGTAGSVDYVFAPEYRLKFPALTDWAELRDYNCDGKQDIFTYGVGGIRVFKNISNPADGLKFTMVSDQLLSLEYGNYINIYVTSVDYPAIEDVDGDGDLDILTFWIGGTYIEYHKNLSQEKFGNCDSLDYKLVKHCWGYIKEGDSTNYITLNAPCGWIGGKEEIPEPSVPPDPQDPASGHVRSTLLAIDLNGDSIRDLILGDVDYPNVIGLINGGTRDSARMITEDNFFPSYNTSVHLYSMPDLNYIDINNDGKRELLASPMDPTPTLTENFHSVWLYNNIGTDTAPVFSLAKNSFLQEDMIDVGTASRPVLVDVDQDGLTDIVVGNFGYYDSSNRVLGILKSYYHSSLAWFRNTGTATNPSFRLMTRNFANVASLHITGASPAFADLDGDGALDMLVGNSNGKMYYFHNNAGPGNPMTFDPPVANYQNLDAGDFSAPQLIDLDNDGLTDLVVGNKKGWLVYYHNTGSAGNPVFTHVTDSLGHVSVSYPNITGTYDGYAIPCFFKGNDGKFRLFTGSLRGGITYYDHIEDSLAGHFTLRDPYYLYLSDGDRSALAVGNLNGDTLPDMIMGTISGGLLYFTGSEPPAPGIENYPGTPISLGIYPNPAAGICRVEVSGFTSNQFYYLEILGLPGNIVRRFNPASTPVEYLDVTGLTSGMYLVRATLIGSQGKSSLSLCRKLVVSH